MYFLWISSWGILGSGFLITAVESFAPFFQSHRPEQRRQPVASILQPSLLDRTAAATALYAAKGFGSSSTTTVAKQKKKSNKKNKKKTPSSASSSFQLDRGSSIEHYLNPDILQNATHMESIRQRLRDGKIVVLRNAFVDDLAAAMHQELLATDTWSRNEDYFDDGYHFRHYNVYDTNDFSPLFHAVNELFDSQATKEFMSALTGRDCRGSPVTGAPSYYGPGDHSLPHTDHIGQRSVAYIWHLCPSTWQPAWGGGLYWAPTNTYLHASYNTLVLFSVTPHSAHFVTTVSPHATTEQRVAYNGWWHADWMPTAGEAAVVEERLATPQQRLTWTHAQINGLQDLLDDPWSPRMQPPERETNIREYRELLLQELYPTEDKI